MVSELEPNDLLYMQNVFVNSWSFESSRQDGWLLANIIKTVCKINYFLNLISLLNSLLSAFKVGEYIPSKQQDTITYLASICLFQHKCIFYCSTIGSKGNSAVIWWIIVIVLRLLRQTCLMSLNISGCGPGSGIRV